MRKCQIQLFMYMYVKISQKQQQQLNSLTSICCLGELEVTHRTAMREVQVRCPSLSTIFMFAVLFCCGCVFPFFCQKHINVMMFFKKNLQCYFI